MRTALIDVDRICCGNKKEAAPEGQYRSREERMLELSPKG